MGEALGVFIGLFLGMHLLGYVSRMVIVMVYDAFSPLLRGRL